MGIVGITSGFLTTALIITGRAGKIIDVGKSEERRGGSKTINLVHKNRERNKSNNGNGNIIRGLKFSNISSGNNSNLRESLRGSNMRESLRVNNMRESRKVSNMRENLRVNDMRESLRVNSMRENLKGNNMRESLRGSLKAGKENTGSRITKSYSL